jgi:ferredoxin/flavodoxin---NADP+ reductase
MSDADRLTPRVAVVGAGPSGFFAVEALLRAGLGIAVDLFERLPVPHGLVRFGVAPDHPKLKAVSAVFERILAQPGVRYIGGVELGADLSLEELRSSYHAVVLATGAPLGKPLGLPGEDLPGVLRASEVVGWYNGHPDHLDCPIDLTATRAVVVGQGNVALDVARVLLKPVDALRQTDIAAHALEALAHSRIREVQVVGRRGPAATRFSLKELKEFEQIPGCVPLLDPSDLGPDSFAVPEGLELEHRVAIEVLAGMGRTDQVAAGALDTAARRCVFRFHLAPVALHGPGRVGGLRLIRTEDWPAGEPGQPVDLSAELVVSSIGRRVQPLHGVPLDALQGTHAQVDGRVVQAGAAMPGLYVCGWAKRGAQGTIGTNRACSGDTVARLLSDLPQLLQRAVPTPAPRLAALLSTRGRWFDLADWQRIDQAERARGASQGKPREKFVHRAHMAAAAWQEASPC